MGAGAVAGRQRPVSKLQTVPSMQLVAVQTGMQMLTALMVLGLMPRQVKPSRSQSMPLAQTRAQNRWPSRSAGWQKPSMGLPPDGKSTHSSSRVHSRLHCPPGRPVSAERRQLRVSRHSTSLSHAP